MTHPRVVDPPSQLETVLDDLDSLFQSPSLNLLREGPRHAVFMQQLIRAGQAAGNLAHDAHIAALVLEHGVRELWTADRDFARLRAGLPPDEKILSKIGKYNEDLVEANALLEVAVLQPSSKGRHARPVFQSKVHGHRRDPEASGTLDKSLMIRGLIVDLGFCRTTM